jgi:hypothetical protein
VLAFADRRESALRAALAEALPPVAAALPTLEKLARDTTSDVRNPARATLAKLRELPWWTGLFASDPLARLSPEDAERAKPDLEAAASILSQPGYEQNDRVDELAAIVRRLPAPLGVELAEHMLGGVEQALNRGAEIGTALLELAGGPEAVYRAVSRWTESREARDVHRGGYAVTAMLELVPEERRAAACVALGALAAKAPPGEAHRGYESPAYVVAQAVHRKWPKGADVAPLLDLVLSSEPPAEGDDFRADWAMRELAGPIGDERAATSGVLERLVEAYLAGEPGRFAAVPCAKAVEHAPLPVLRAAAERALASEDDPLATWGLRQILGRAHDPARDGARAPLVARLWDDPRSRRLMMGAYDLEVLALAQLRAALRAGALDFEGAVDTLRIVGRLYGGLADTDAVPRAVRAAHRGTPDPDPLEGLEDVLSDPAFAGPPTEDEWARYRTIRAAAPADELRRGGLEILPDGPWHPEDRAALERGFAALRAEPDDHLAWSLAIALRAKPVAEDEPRFDGLMGTEFDKYVRGCRRAFREALGLPPLGTSATDEEAPDDDAGNGDWLDDDEE